MIKARKKKLFRKKTIKMFHHKANFENIKSQQNDGMTIK